MISDQAKSQMSTRNTARDILVILLVFILLALAIWRWFDYRIARIHQYDSSPAVGLYDTHTFTYNV